MFGINPLASRPIPDDYDKIRSIFPIGVEGKAGIQSDAILKVTVAPATSGGGNRFYIDGVENPALTLRRGTKYIFDVSDSTNVGHPLRFKNSDGSNYLTNVIITGLQGTAGATVEITIAADAPDSLRYYCTQHGNGMGNTITVANFINIATAANVSLTGVSATASTGEARFVHFFDVTGVEATAQVGAIAGVFEGAGALATGLQANGGVGSLDFSLECVFSVTGVEAEVQLGIPIRFETVELEDGFEATASVGTANVDLQLDVPVTGIGATGSTNSVTVTTEQNLLMSGVAATGQVDSVFVTGIGNLTVTGVEATADPASLGTIILNIVYSVDGVGSTGSVGTVSISADSNLSLGSVSAALMSVGQVVLYDQIAFLDVPINVLDAIDLVEDENVPIEDVFVDLPANLTEEEDFTEEAPSVTDTFVALNLDQVPNLGTADPTDEEPTSDIYTEVEPQNDVPSDLYSEVNVSVNNNPYTGLGDDLANTSYNEVDVTANTVYTDEEINQEDFEGRVILDAA